MLTWLESDGTTPLGSINLGTVGPGESYAGKHGGAALQVVLKNTGGSDVEQITVSIVPIGQYAAVNYVAIAMGPTQPDSGDFVGIGDPALEVGTLEPDDTVNIWVDMIVPLAANRGLGQMVTLRATGTEQ